MPTAKLCGLTIQQRTETMPDKYKISTSISRYGFKSVFTKNILYSCLIIILSFSLITVHTYYNSLKEFKYASQHVAKEKSDTVAKAYDSSLKTISNLVYEIINNKNIYNTFYGVPVRNEDESINYDAIMNYLSVISTWHQYVDAISLYVEKEDIVISASSCFAIDKSHNKAYKYYKDSSVPILSMYSEKNGSLSELNIVYRYCDYQSNPLGYLLFQINIRHFYESLGAPTPSNSKDIMLCVNSSGTVITSSRSSHLGVKLKKLIPDLDTNDIVELDGNKYFHEQTRAYLGGQYVYLCGTNLSEVLKEQMLKVIMIMLIYIVIASILLSLFITSRNSRPLLEILSFLQKLPFVSEKSTDETAFITQILAALEEQRVNLTEEIGRKLSLAHKFQLKAYQNQMNPHFLCNTLETLKWMAFDYETDDFRLSDSIENLSKIAKYSLDSNDYIVNLSTEIDYTETYIKILQLRFPDKLEFNWDISADLSGMKTLKFCMQPFIENAVQYGLKNRSRPLRVDISIHTEDKFLIIKISDNGTGISHDKLAELQNKLSSADPANLSEGIGILNTNARIKLVYGDECGVHIDSHENEGTTIIVIMNKSK